QLDLWQWLCGTPKKVFAKLAFGFQRDIATEDEVNALVDFGDGATGHSLPPPTATAAPARPRSPSARAKAAVAAPKKVTITRLSENERALSDKMTMQDVAELFRGEMDPSSVYTVEEKEYESVWGKQHIDVLTNFAAHINHGTPLIADGAEGINGVRL